MPQFDDGAVAAERPRLGPSPAWVYLWHRASWTVMLGKVVPRLDKLLMVPGVNRVAQSRNGAYQVREALAAKEERGWRPVCKDVSEYLREVEGMPGHYLSRWETAHAGTDRVTADTEGYVAWLVGKITSGAIERPQLYVLDSMRSRAAEAVTRLRDQAHIPSARAALVVAEAELAAIEAEIATIAEAAAPVASRKATIAMEG